MESKNLGERKPLSLRWNFDWRWLRGVGQLQLLNLISFSLLIFIPILAGFWPVVRLTVYQYNSAATESRQQLIKLKTELDSTLRNVTVKSNDETVITREQTTASTSQSLHSLSSTYTKLIDDLVSHLDLNMAKAPDLPNAWVFSFFASLSILLARTLFELSCPAIIREFSVDSFVESRKNDYAKTPSDWSLFEALRSLSGTEILKTAQDEEIRYGHQQRCDIDNLLGDIRKVDLQLSFIRHGSQQTEINAELAQAHKIRRELIEQLRFVMEAESGQNSPHFRRRMSMIEASARERYLSTARENLFAGVVCFLLYLTGFLSLLFVVFCQAMNVVRAAGWLDS